jgi:hypothetical protein
MRRTAERLADAGEETVTRDIFTREVIHDFCERGGLVVRKVSSTADSGHYAWIWSWMQTFLMRNLDIIARSTATELRLTRKVVKTEEGPSRTGAHGRAQRTSDGLRARRYAYTRVTGCW